MEDLHMSAGVMKGRDDSDQGTLLFIIRCNLCTCVNEEGGDGEAAHSETPSLLSYTLRYVSFTEVDSVCRVVLRESMYLCTCVIEEGVDGETEHSETPSLLSYTLRYVSFTEVYRV
jgi:hypothetical protein